MELTKEELEDVFRQRKHIIEVIDGWVVEFDRMKSENEELKRKVKELEELLTKNGL